jgi:hypothetical protein
MNQSIYLTALSFVRPAVTDYSANHAPSSKVPLAFLLSSRSFFTALAPKWTDDGKAGPASADFLNQRTIALLQRSPTFRYTQNVRFNFPSLTDEDIDAALSQMQCPRYVYIVSAALSKDFVQRALVKYPTIREVRLGDTVPNRDAVYSDIIVNAASAEPTFGEALLKNTLSHYRRMLPHTKDATLVRRCILPVLTRDRLWRDLEVYVEAMHFVKAFVTMRPSVLGPAAGLKEVLASMIVMSDIGHSQIIQCLVATLASMAQRKEYYSSPEIVQALCRRSCAGGDPARPDVRFRHC